MTNVKYVSSVKNPLIKPCPCAKNHKSCGYFVISQIVGCPYNCVYCYLSTFYGEDEIVVVTDEDRILKETKELMDSNPRSLRIGTGEFSDSLSMPEAVSIAKKLVKLFSGQKKDLLELKTKSTNVSELLDLDHNGQTVIGWSVNPECIAKTEEPNAPTLPQRLKAAKECAKAGYSISFHFDPIIYFRGWEGEYAGVVEQIFDNVPARQIAWISLGGLRFPIKQKDIMLNKYETKIVFSYLEQGQDNKLRYPKNLRIDLFTHVCEIIHKQDKDLYLYLCMEEKTVIESLDHFINRGRFSGYFDWELNSQK